MLGTYYIFWFANFFPLSFKNGGGDIYFTDGCRLSCSAAYNLALSARKFIFLRPIRSMWFVWRKDSIFLVFTIFFNENKIIYFSMIFNNIEDNSVIYKCAKFQNNQQIVFELSCTRFTKKWVWEKRIYACCALCRAIIRVHRQWRRISLWTFRTIFYASLTNISCKNKKWLFESCKGISSLKFLIILVSTNTVLFLTRLVTGS